MISKAPVPVAAAWADIRFASGWITQNKNEVWPWSLAVS